jgi:hypothetical protein
MWQERARILSERLALEAPPAPGSPLTAPTVPEAPEPTPRLPLAHARLWAPWLLAALAIVAAVVLLAWR